MRLASIGPEVEVERVVDSDTLIAWVRYSPRMKIRERIRLKGIEGGELGTAAGAAGTAALAAIIAKDHFRPWFLLGNTECRDQFDRIVADLVSNHGDLLTRLLFEGGTHWRRSRSGEEWPLDRGPDI